MNNLLKEAIADAKAVRETALANAKLALEEAFTPRLQSMLSAKLSEEEGMEDEMPMDEPAEEPAMDDMPAEGRGMNDADEDPTDVHSEADHSEEPTDEGSRGMMDADEDPTDVHSEELADEEPTTDEDLELEAILRELEEEEGDEPKVDEQSGSTGIGAGDNKMKAATSGDEDDPGKGDLMKGVGMTEGKDDETTDEGSRGDKETDENVDLDEIINALREEEGDDDKTTDEGSRGEKETDEGHTAGVDDGAAAKDLEEAYKVIKFMRGKLNEVNLLNAKLLFSNKLFRNHSLNESQKMRVIENFDRAQTLREVKLVFATLSESFKFGKKKSTIKESYASKPTRTTRPAKSILSEGNTLANRWKKLAGLNG